MYHKIGIFIKIYNEFWRKNVGGINVIKGEKHL